VDLLPTHRFLGFRLSSKSILNNIIRVLVGVAFIILILSVYVIANRRLDSPPQKLSIHNVFLIRKGMSVEDALHLLGPPTKERRDGFGMVTLTWEEGPKSVWIDAKPDKNGNLVVDRIHWD
jgi:hypothetical protein